MIRLTLTIAALLCLSALPASAQDDSDLQPDTILDSVYFTMDDGIMTPKEMEMEAAYVHRICAGNPYQAIYFDCGCLSGAFLIEREKVGPMIPQSEIFAKVMSREKGTCANLPMIAGNAYNSCKTYRTNFQPLERDTEEYCTCVGNKVARDFPKIPKMNPGNVRAVTINGMNYCTDPQNRRPAKKQAGSPSSTIGNNTDTP